MKFYFVQQVLYNFSCFQVFMIMTTFVQVSLDPKCLQLVSSLVEKDVKVDDNRNSAVIVIIGYFFIEIWPKKISQEKNKASVV